MAAQGFGEWDKIKQWNFFDFLCDLMDLMLNIALVVSFFFFIFFFSNASYLRVNTYCEF